MSENFGHSASANTVMRAYAIFDGGGVLGAALAGALKAAEDKGIEFAGFGGTSAGSIVAALAAFGYAGSEIETILVETDFTEFLNDSGKPVEAFKERLSEILRLISLGGNLNGVRALFKAPSIVKSLRAKRGVDDGKTLAKFLLDKIKVKHPSLMDRSEVRFEDIEALGCRSLKIVASDVTRRMPVVFSSKNLRHGTSVLNAVRASACYPFIFQPVELNDGALLVDGGLASNLPAFLFHEEQRQTKLPVFAFDLVSQSGPPKSPFELDRFMRDMISTALDAGDELIRQVLVNIIHVPIEIPEDFDVLDFKMDQSRREELFRKGYDQVSLFLDNSCEPFRIARQVKDIPEFLKRSDIGGIDRISEQLMRRMLQARFGNPKLLETVLSGLAREIEATTQARAVRATIMLPTDRKNPINQKPTRIVVYSHGMRDENGEEHDDATLEIDEDAGCTGLAWINRAPAVADLEKAKDNPVWKMTIDQHQRIPRDRKSMLAIPIGIDRPPATSLEKATSRGTLSIDSETPLDDTLWIETDDANVVVSREVLKTMQLWENVIRSLFR